MDKIIDLNLEGSGKKLLLISAGLSSNSRIQTEDVIKRNWHKIQSKYKAAYIVCYKAEAKAAQEKACNLRAIYNRFSCILPKWIIYKPETDLNEEIAKQIYSLLLINREFNTFEIDLLGKCAGAGIMIHLFAMDKNMFGGLFLGVPASPLALQHLVDRQVTNKTIICAWNTQDIYEFPWGRSCDEKDRYGKTVSKLSGINFIELCITTENADTFFDPTIHHQIPNALFNLIQ